MDFDSLIRLVRSEEYTVALTDGERLITSKERGIKPLMQLIARNENVAGMLAADKIVGRAAALLYAHMRIRAVHACVLSEGGLKVLRDNGIAAYYDTLTANIINRKGDGMCPMEQAVVGTDDPAAAVGLISAKIAELQKK